jgi:dTDP-4-dehydrorhamnose 3,5-epimerase
MKLVSTPIPDVYEVQTKILQDDRGSFARLFCAEELQEIHQKRTIVQINHSLTLQVGALRGLHFQYPPHAEAKWVRCLRGCVWDVTLDLRCHSPTFLNWHAVELSSEKMNAIFIPEGCAHGFQVLEPNSELLYLHTAFYAPEYEGGIHYNDPLIEIDWPLSITDVSTKDKNRPFLEKTFEGISL